MEPLFLDQLLAEVPQFVPVALVKNMRMQLLVSDGIVVQKRARRLRNRWVHHTRDNGCGALGGARPWWYVVFSAVAVLQLWCPCQSQIG